MGLLDSLGLKDIVTFVIAVYGAILSSVVFYRPVLKERRRIVVTLTTAFYTYPQGLGPPMAQIEVTNDGHRPVVVSAPKLLLPNGQYMLLMGADGIGDFPKRLEDGESAGVRMQYDAIADGLREAGYSGNVALWPVCSDSTGLTFKGDKWEFDISKNWWRNI